MTKRMVTALWSGIVLIGAVTAYATVAGAGHTGKVMAPDALTTDAPQAIVMSAVTKVYEELRLRHFMDAKGYVRFADGTSTDNSKQEWERGTGDFVQGVTSFDDPDGNRITIRRYSSPQFGTLLAWEYGNGKDVRKILTVVQQELARQGVKVR